MINKQIMKEKYESEFDRKKNFDQILEQSSKRRYPYRLTIVLASLVFLFLTFPKYFMKSEDHVLMNDQINKEVTEENFNAYEDLEGEILNVISYTELNHNISDLSLMMDMSSNVVLAKIVSIDGGSNINQITNEYVYPYTFGKMEIIDTIKGQVEEGEIVEYVRMGGIVSFEDYYNSLYPAQKEKHLSSLENVPSYVKMQFNGDIDVEVGKTYLMCLIDSSEGNVALEDAYAIIGWQGGLREILINNSAQMYSQKNSGLEVLNNFTGEWENLAEVLEENSK